MLANVIDSVLELVDIDDFQDFPSSRGKHSKMFLSQ
jgi:hypothetical protein